MSDGDYRSLLQYPKWIKKRNKILRRDKWTCTACGNKKDLQVHHTYYKDGFTPWQYPDHTLITLCGDCHYQFHCEHEVPIYKKQKSKSKRSKLVVKKEKKRKIKKPKPNHFTERPGEQKTRYRKKTKDGFIYFTKEG